MAPRKRPSRRDTSDRPSVEPQSNLSQRPFAKLRPPAQGTQPSLRRTPRAPAPSVAGPSALADEAALFLQAIGDVTPLPEGPGRAAAPAAARLPDPTAEDEEVRAELLALVRGEASFRLSDTAEFLEGAATDVDRRTRLRLRRGEFAIQGQLDLHGQTRDEAKAGVGAFVLAERKIGHRCVLIVHGRGLNSKDHVPILKEQMGTWLSRGSTGRAVLAFCSARPCDGGAGAVYVLLRKI